ncbi:MAG: SPW repeat protein [Halobacteriaceae archaeon]
MASDNLIKWTSGIAALGGIWAIIAPFIWMGVSSSMMWSNIIIGAAVFLLAGFSWYRKYTGESAHKVASWLAAIGGLWFIVAPFVFTGVPNNLMITNVIAGIIVAVLAGYTAYQGGETEGFTAGEPTV